MKQAWRVAQCALLTFTCSLSFAQSALAVDYAGIGGKPAYPQEGNPRTESIFVHTIVAGQSADDGVLLVNNSETTKTLQVYAVDSVNSSDGAFACAQKADQSKTVGTWIALESSEVTLEPNTTATVPMKITVPATANVGESDGCVVIQEKKSDADVQSGMSLSFRTAIRVAITVPGKITRLLSIAELSHQKKSDGSHVVNIGVTNNGNVSIDADVQTDVQSLLSTALFAQHGSIPVLRSQTSSLHFDLPKTFWGGWYRATVAVSYDAHQDAAIGVSSGKGDTVLHSQTAWFFIAPSTNGLIIEIGIAAALLLLIILAIVVLYRRRWIRKTWVEYSVQSTDDIKQVAEQHKVSWKLLVKVNHLRAPYTLHAGDMLRVPHMLTDEPIAESAEESNISAKTEKSDAALGKQKKSKPRQRKK